MSTSERRTGGPDSPVLFIVDQILSSTSNAVLSFTVLLTASSSEFGEFALGMAIIAIAVGFVRSGVLEWELVPGKGGTGLRHLSRRSIGWALALSAPAVVLLALLGVLAPTTALTFGLAAIVSSLCDAFRFSALGGGRSMEACAIDAAWLVMLAGGCLALHLAVGLNLSNVLVAYVITGAAATALGAARLEAGAWHRPPPASSGSASFGLDFALNLASGHAVVFALPLVLGLSGLGHYRAALTLFQPYTTLSYSLRLHQLKHLEWRRLPGRSLAVGMGAQLGLAVLYGLPLLIVMATGLSDDVDSLRGVGTGVFAIAALSEALRTTSQVSFDLARIQGQLRAVVSNRVVQIVCLLVGSLFLAHRAGVGGAVSARALAYGLVLISSTVVGLRAARPPLEGRAAHGEGP